MQAADFHALYAFTASAPIASSTAHQSELMHSRSQLRCDTGGEATREAVAVLRWKSTAWLTPDPTTASEVVLELTGGDGPGMVAHEGDLAVALVGRAVDLVLPGLAPKAADLVGGGWREAAAEVFVEG